MTSLVPYNSLPIDSYRPHRICEGVERQHPLGVNLPKVLATKGRGGGLVVSALA